jgi:hypothetical protein
VIGAVSEMERTTSFVSRAELLESFEGDAGFVREITIAFLQSCPLALAELRAGLEAGDTEAVTRTAHSLRGTLAYFDQGGVLDAVRRLEALTTADLPRASKMLGQLEECMEDLTGHLVDDLAHEW